MTFRREEPMTKRLVLVSAALVMAGLSCGSALAQTPYPAKGQSPQQQQKDMAECQAWAAQQTGGPAAAPQPTATGQGVRGAARGAAIGAVGGAIGGDAGKGAAIGAATGAMVGGVQRRQDRRAAQAASTQQNANFSGAISACLEGRGYTVR
jgi:hypothetical protein